MSSYVVHPKNNAAMNIIIKLKRTIKPNFSRIACDDTVCVETIVTDAMEVVDLKQITLEIVYRYKHTHY